MATLESAAEELVVKLRGLDSELEESGRKLEHLRERVEGAAGEIGREWTALSEAATSFFDTVGEEQEALATAAEQELAVLARARQAVAEHGASARGEIDEGRGGLDATRRHATDLEPELASLAAEAGEAPARGLADRARELEEELERLVDDARGFLSADVVPAVEQVGRAVQERCRELHRLMADQQASMLQQVFDAWESKVDRLEEYVAMKAFQASHQHAREMVDYALEECGTAARQRLEDLQQLLGLLAGQIRQMAADVHLAAETLVTEAGRELVQELEQARAAGARAVTTLDAVRRTLAAYSFVEV